MTSKLQTFSNHSETESQRLTSQVDSTEKLLTAKTEELKKEKQKTKKLGETARKLKRDVARLNSIVGDQKAQILEMNDAVAKAIADRQMQAKENEFLRQIHLPTPTRGEQQHRQLRSTSAASSFTGAGGLLTPPPLMAAPTMMTTVKSTSDHDVRQSTSFQASVGEEG